MPSGISRDGSSSSDSGGGGVAVGAGWGLRGARVGTADTASVSFEARDEFASIFSGVFFSISGGRSVVLCFPSVQGGISRNSSKVKTLGLQHFQPKHGEYGLALANLFVAYS